MNRDAAEFHEASYSFDPATTCDSITDQIAELLAEHWPHQRGTPGLKKLAKVVTRIMRQLLKEGANTGLDVERIQGRELMAKLTAEIIDSPHPRLMARAIDLAFGFGVQLGLNETEIAELENVTKATASHYCIALKDTYLKGMPARGMKSNQAVAKYRELNTGKANRANREAWQFEKVFKAAYKQ